MTALVPVWTPEDFAETAAAAWEHYRATVAEVPPVMNRESRGRRHRGEHRPAPHRRTVGELRAELDADPTQWQRPGGAR